MDDEQSQTRSLKPTLGLFDATAISVGAIVGAGIFIVTGIAAGYAGSALIISMIIAAAISSFTALSFAELTSWSPKEGSIYEFGHALIAPSAGFIAGWMWILSNTFSGAAVSLSFAYYFHEILPSIPPQYVAAFLCTAFTALNYFGVKRSARLNNFLVVTKLGILAFFCAFGLFFANTTNFLPFAPFQTGVLAASFYIFFAYGGFARVAVVAEEVKDASRNVPKAIILSLIISTMFYVVVGAVAVGLSGSSGLSHSKSPLADAISITGNSFAVRIVTIGGMLAAASVLLTSILGVSRMAYAMARRDDLPKQLGKLHPKHGTPYYSIWITGIAMLFLVLFTDLTNVVAVGTFAMLFYYTFANISALRLPKQCRKYPSVVPAVGATSCVVLLGFVIFVSQTTLLVGLICVLLGGMFYIAKKAFTNHRLGER